jgi:diguanylate cyclase (GGDEF)-like protein
MPASVLQYLNWRRIIGPLATIAAAIGIFLLYRYWAQPPIAAPIFLWAIVLSAYYGGVTSGLVSTAIAIAFGVYYLSEPGAPFTFEPTNLARFVVLALTAVATAITVGLLHRRERRALKTEREAREIVEVVNRDLLTLRAALEEVDYGVVLLDTELCAIFINRAFRRIWKLSDEKADSRPAFVALLYHGRDTKAYAISRDELDAFVSHRMSLVQHGDETPLDLRLSNGEIIRFRCKVLPDGGRMLTYASVTDLVRHAEQQQALAITDPLTGLNNRRRFFALAEAEWVRAGRYERPLSMLMIDIDHFKSVNDRFGHDVGDKVITRVAEVCWSGKREMDILARVGGEEFAILLPETTVGDAVLVAERLRAAVAAAQHPQVPQVTVSIGAAQASATANSIAKLMKQADNALYDAKRQGRNRVVGGPDINRQVA